MILVDTGVLIDFLRTKDAKLDGFFRALPVAVCGVIRAEILCGARGTADHQRLLVFLHPFRYVAAPESIWDRVGENLATMRASGITVPFPDAVIATLAIENDIEVWARDPHFPIMQKMFPLLKLFQEPP